MAYKNNELASLLLSHCLLGCPALPVLPYHSPLLLSFAAPLASALYLFALLFLYPYLRPCPSECWHPPSQAFHVGGVIQLVSSALSEFGTQPRSINLHFLRFCWSFGSNSCLFPLSACVNHIFVIRSCHIHTSRILPPLLDLPPAQCLPSQRECHLSFLLRKTMRQEQ